MCTHPLVRIVATEYEEEIDSSLHMQASKPSLHEHEENLYEMIPDYVQSPRLHVTIADRVSSGSDSTKHLTPSHSRGENNEAEVKTHVPVS